MAAILLAFCPALTFADETVAGAAAAEADAAQLSPAKAYELKQQEMVRTLKKMDNSLLTPEIFKAFSSGNRDYRSVLSSGTNGRNPKDMETLRMGLRYRIYSLSDRDIQNDARALEDAYKNLSRDLGRAGSLMPNPGDKQRFRELLFSEAVPMLQKLLDNNLLARSLALEALLETIVATPSNRKPSLYDTVDDIYISVLKSPDQPDVIKARTAHSIRKYLVKADAVPQVQIAFATAIINELKNNLTDKDYQYVLLTALEEIAAPREVVGQKRPIVMMAATDVMRDRSRDNLVRCRAASILGIAGSDSQINYDVLAWAVSELALEMGSRFNQSQNRSSPEWQLCGWYLYLAFHHADRQKMSNGFLNRAPKSTVVRDAYQNSLPVMLDLMVSKNPVPNTKLGALLKWTNGNKPNPLVYDPAAPPLQ